MKNFDTVSQAIQSLKDEGYGEDFNLKENCLECQNGKYKVFHDEFVVDKFYRFEGMTDPADESIVYAISSPKFKLKGVLVNGYGIYTDSMANEMMNKLRIS